MNDTRQESNQEATPLLLNESRGQQPALQDSPGNVSSSANTSVESEYVAELERPWPATFERSMSLLAGPTLDFTMVDIVTKSPKIMTPHQAARARQRLMHPNDALTPEPKLIPMRREFNASENDLQFQKGMKKHQSLDFGPSTASTPSSTTMSPEQMDRRAMEAKVYRQKLLSATTTAAQPFPATAVTNGRKQRPDRNDEETGLMDSPGYNREKESDRQRKKTPDDANGSAAGRSVEKSSFSQCVFNMANILMGVGLLGLPFVFRSAGWIGGFVVTIGFGAVTWRTSILIGRELNGDPRPGYIFDDSPFKTPTVPGSSPAARMRKPIHSFPDIAREAFGEEGCIMLSSVLYFELFSCLCIFFVTLGDHLHAVIPSISTTRLMIYTSFVLTIPTALLRTPRLLSYLSMVGTFATVAVVLSVMASAIFEGDIAEPVAVKEGLKNASPYHVLWKTSGLPVALGLIAYTFSGHAIVPSIYSSMARPQDFEKMIDLTFGIVVVACLCVAVSGYYMFGTTVEDQVTISLTNATTSADMAMTMLTWLMILTAFSKFTLTMFPLALGLEEIVALYVPSDKVMEVASSVMKLILIVLALVVAIFVPSFSFLCSLVGLICTMVVSCIFPAAAHLKLFGPHLSVSDKIIDWLFIITGSVVAIVGTVATVGM